MKKWEQTRKRIFEIIEVADENDILSRIYDWIMLVCIFASIIPLAFKKTYPAFKLIDQITVTVFIIDYLLRLITADQKLQKKSPQVFFLYPFTPMAVIDLLSILPSVSVIHQTFKILKMARLLRTFRVFRVFKFLRYSRNFVTIKNVFTKQKEALTAVFTLAIAYILIAALVILNVEPDTFDSFFEAVYWAAISLTTLGYGDIYPVSTIGRLVTMASSFVGIAIVALPAGIITAGYMDEISRPE